MKLAVISEAKYDNFRRGTIEWYLKNFFDHQPDTYDDAGIRYYTVKPGYDVYLSGYKIDAVELDTYSRPGIGVKGNGNKLTRIKVWRSNGTPMRHDYLYDFGDEIEIYETRKVDLPQWVRPD